MFLLGIQHRQEIPQVNDEQGIKDSAWSIWMASIGRKQIPRKVCPYMRELVAISYSHFSLGVFSSITSDNLIQDYNQTIFSLDLQYPI